MARKAADHERKLDPVAPQDLDSSFVSIRRVGDVYFVKIGDTLHQLTRAQFRVLMARVIDIMQTEVPLPENTRPS